MWLLETSIKMAIEQARASGFQPTAEQLRDFTAAAASSGASSRILAVAGDKAQININGVLTQTPDFFAEYFGGGNTTYPEIISALAEAESDPDVKEIVLAVSSPGGHVNGMFEAIAALEAVKKPMKAIASQATSAAYALASQADSIAATGPSASFGSIGVALQMGVHDDVVTLTSTNAPKKRPDVTTAEGKEMVVEELDALHSIFVDAIASGRGTTVEKINADYGEGGTLFAQDAQKRGMIDSIIAKTATATNNGGKSQETRSMDLNTLKAQHPDVYAAAAQEGADQEHDRVCAFIVAGETSGDMKTATSAIKDKSEMTMTLQTSFMMAAANKSDLNARAADDAVAAAAVDHANAPDADADATAAAAILENAAAACGVELEV